MFPHGPGQSQDVAPCLSYYGSSTTGKWSFYGTSDETCKDEAFSEMDQGGLADAAWPANTRLVWFESDAAAVDDSLLPAQPQDALNILLSSVNAALPVSALDGQQQVLSGEEKPEPVEVMYRERAGSAMLLRVDESLVSTIDTHLPRFWKSMVIPSEPQPFVPVPAPAVERVKDILKHVKFNPVVASIVNNISVPLMKCDIRWLTGEDPKSPIVSRHSFSDDARTAAKWLKERFEETGAECKLEPFLTGFTPNVIWCVLMNPIAVTHAKCPSQRVPRDREHD